MQLGTLIMTRNVNVYGYIATSAYGIGNKINSLITMPASGVGSAVSTIVGQNMGAGNTERAKKTFHYSLKMCTFFYLFWDSFFKTPCFPDYGIILSTDAKVIPLAADYLSIIAFWCFTNAFYNVSQGLFQGCGHTLITMLVDASRIWLFRLLSLWICANVFHMGVASVWYSVVISNGTSAIILYLLYWTGIWKKDMQTLSRAFHILFSFTLIFYFQLSKFVAN